MRKLSGDHMLIIQDITLILAGADGAAAAEWLEDGVSEGFIHRIDIAYADQPDTCVVVIEETEVIVPRTLLTITGNEDGSWQPTVPLHDADGNTLSAAVTPIVEGRLEARASNGNAGAIHIRIFRELP